MNKPKPQMKFSHAYKKLLDQHGNAIKEAKLLLVVPVSHDMISRAKDFIAYDTDNGKYTLSFATFYVMLIFQKPFGDLFTTVRPMHGRFGNKQTYYEGMIGQEFEIVINVPKTSTAPQLDIPLTREPRPDMMGESKQEFAERMNYYQRHLK
jgi:hypothetical protein